MIKSQASNLKQAPNYNIQWQKRGFVWNIGISVIEIRKSQKSSHAYVVLRRTGTKVQTNNKLQASNLKQITSTNIQWQKRGLVWNIGISVIGIWKSQNSSTKIQTNYKHQITITPEADKYPMTKTWVSLEHWNFGHWNSKITKLKHKNSNKHQISITPEADKYPMTKTWVCLRLWNFDHWDLFVICYLGFGI